METHRASDVLRRHFHTFTSGGLEEAAKLWDPDIEWQPLQGTAHEVRGRDAMRRYYAEWVDTLEDLRGEVDEVVSEDGATVAARIRNSGRGRVSGVPAAGTYYVACLVRDGKIAVVREFVSREEAIAAARSLADGAGR